MSKTMFLFKAGPNLGWHCGKGLFITAFISSRSV